MVEKMKYYGISPSLVKRIIRNPVRTEESVVPGTIAAMQPKRTKRYQEVWTIYKLIGRANSKSQNPKPKLKIITAWIYPGKSPERDPIPKEILEEIKSIL